MAIDKVWYGAPVRWTGPDWFDGETHLRTGATAVVIDPGRFRVGQVTGVRVVAPEMTVLRRAGWGVLLELPDGSEVEADPALLDLDLREHPLTGEPDTSVADWWRAEVEPRWSRRPPVSALVPRSFAAVCRVLHPGPDDETPAIEGELPDEVAAGLVRVLAGHTTTPEEVHVAVWDGWSDRPQLQFPDAGQLDTTPHGYFLLRGPLDGLLTPIGPGAVWERPAAGVWWPRDRAWFVCTDVDLTWTFVAGPRELVRQVLRDDELVAVPAGFDELAYVLPS